MAIYFNGQEVGNLEATYELANNNIWVQETEPEDAPVGSIWIDTAEDTEVALECDTEMSDTSERPVQNKVIKSYVDGSKPTLVELHKALGTGWAGVSGDFANYDLLYIGARPSANAAMMNITIPAILANDVIRFQVADEAKYSIWELNATNIWRVEGDGLIEYIYGVKY